MASFITKERELILARLKELDGVEERVNKLLEEKEKKKTEFTEKEREEKMEIERKEKTLEDNISKLDLKLTAMKDAYLTKDQQWKKEFEVFEGQKTELNIKITDMEQKLIEIEKKITPLIIPDNSGCAVCLDVLFPPKKIFQCLEGHIVCDTCLEKLPDPKTCPTCRLPGPYSRNRALEHLHCRVAEEEKVSRKKRRQDRMLAEDEIGTLMEQKEALKHQLSHCCARKDYISKEKACFAAEISAVQEEKSTLEKQVFEISLALKKLKFKWFSVEEDFDRRIREEREKNQLVAPEDEKEDRAAELKWVTSGYHGLIQDLLGGVNELVNCPEGEEPWYFYATHIVTLHMEIDGYEIPDIQILLAGKIYPHYVEKFLQLCNSHYKNSRIHWVDADREIRGGQGTRVSTVEFKTDPYSNEDLSLAQGEVIMHRNPEIGTEKNTWFAIEVGAEPRGLRTKKVVSVGRVLDYLTPGSGIRVIMENAKIRRGSRGSVTNKIIIKDTKIRTLDPPFMVPVF